MFDAYLRYEYYFAATQLALAMLGMGATLRLKDFIDVFRVPAALLLGIAVQVVGVPLIASLVNALAGPPPGIAFGLILVAAMPGGAMSNVVTYLARANVPLSIALTAIVTLSCLVTTPMVLKLLAPQYLRPDFAMPAGSIAFDIACCLLAPLAVGMILGSLHPSGRVRFSNWCIRGSLFVILLMVVGSTGAGRIDAGEHGWGAPLAILAFAFAAQQAGVAPAWAIGLPRRDLAAIGIETTIRNTNLALLLKASLFPVTPGVPDPVADGVLFVALLYAALAAPVVTPLVLLSRRLAVIPIRSPSTELARESKGEVMTPSTTARNLDP